MNIQAQGARLRVKEGFRHLGPIRVVDTDEQNVLHIGRIYFFFPFLSSTRGATGGRSAWCLACLALCASLLPDEFFLGFLSPMIGYIPCLRIRWLDFFDSSLPTLTSGVAPPEGLSLSLSMAALISFFEGRFTAQGTRFPADKAGLGSREEAEAPSHGACAVAGEAMPTCPTTLRRRPSRGRRARRPRASKSNKPPPHIASLLA